MRNLLANKKIQTLLICLAFIPLVFGISMAAGAYASKAGTAKTDSTAVTGIKNELAAEFRNYGTMLHPVKLVSPPLERSKSTQASAASKNIGVPSEKQAQPAKIAQNTQVPSKHERQPGTNPAQASDPAQKSASNSAQTSKRVQNHASNQAEAAKTAQSPASNQDQGTKIAQSLASNQDQGTKIAQRSASNQAETAKPAQQQAQNPDPAQKPGHEETSNSTPAPAQSKPSAKPPAPSGKQRELYLTFDDGPHRVSNQILDLLDKYNAKATFFLLDGNMKQYPVQVKRMAASGHSLGMHGVSHNKQKFYHSAQTVVAEMDQGKDTIKRITGIDTALIRTPFGSSPYMTADYKRAVAEHGYKMWDWNVDSRDWYYRDRRFVDSTIEQIEKQKGKPGPIVVLLHEREETLANLPALLDYLKSQNFKLVPLTSSMVPIQFK
ncbi:polysaccharide deacetylase family protein [Neobacillus sp. YIM B06451]|uniref:polysaccharide deacetylase family protein n=1 Tax=Neobacillus sp. YIM B06451 TaxID=3070994 RepID=UPI00293067D3|nr:polysaccharide deacetylase family protein [Neobacillus sp. YIM B06451]